MTRGRRPSELRLADLDGHLCTLEGPELERALTSLAEDPRAGAKKVAEKWRRKMDAEAAEERRLRVMLEFETDLAGQGYRCIAGVDEVGRGALAGPLVAAAVVLPDGDPIRGLRDSKELDAAHREDLETRIRELAEAVGVGTVEPDEIDTMGIQPANMLAMRRALDDLQVACDYVLADAFELKGLDMPCAGIVRGDRRSASIAAASIVAKVTRDRLMVRMGDTHPGYGFEHNVGYGCEEHMQALRELGPCAIHRRSFAPVTASAQERLDLG